MTDKTQDWIDIAPLDAVPRLGARVVRREGRPDIAIFRTRDDRIFALEDRCPHRGGPLSQGIVHDCRVTCPLHNWVLELDTGRAVAPDEGTVRRFRVRVAKGVIQLARADLVDGNGAGETGCDAEAGLERCA